MGAPRTDHVRNVALVGHGGAGKTSLAEALLYEAGVTSRLGSVDEGHSNLDYDPEEIKRKTTISLSLAPFTFEDHKVNIIDTPGYPDFIGDAICGMEAAEMALFVVDAISGVQVMTERLWHIADKMQISHAIFVNRMDKEHADFDAALAGLTEAFGHRVGAVEIPIGAAETFEGVIDIIRMRAYIHKSGEPERSVEIPAEYVDAAEEARDKLCELVAEADDDLMMKYLESDERLTQEELENLLGKAIAQGIFIPVYAGCSIHREGIRQLTRDICSFFPYPRRHGPIEMADGSKTSVREDGESAGFVFKTLSDPYVGRLSLVKIISGGFSPNMELINARTGKKERIPHLLEMCGKETRDIDGAPGGDIVVLPKLLETHTGDTLSATGDVAIAPLSFPQSLHSVAIVAKTKADEDKLGESLYRIVEEEPTLQLRRDEETHQTVLSGVGDAQIDVVLSQLKERNNVEAETVELRIPYRETIRKTATAQGRHKKQTGGSGQFGDCWLRLEPNPGGGFEFLDEVVGGRIPRQFIPAVEKGVIATMEEGVLAGYPVVDVKVAVYDGSYHSVDSNEMAFKMAARIAFRAACEKANMVLLEPMSELTVTVPETYAGAVMGDLPTRRGRVAGMESDEYGRSVIKAVAPYAEVVDYSTQLRSLSHGTGEYSIEGQGYEEVPREIAQKVIQAAQEARAEGNK